MNMIRKYDELKKNINQLIKCVPKLKFYQIFFVINLTEPSECGQEEYFPSYHYIAIQLKSV